MGLAKCCDKYVQKSSPKKQGKGKFSEIHECPTCKKKLKITFEEISTLGNPTDYQAVGADYV